MHSLPTVPSNSCKASNSEISFAKRAQLTTHPVAHKLFEIIERKKANLILAADVTKQSELLQLADLLGPKICMLKTHIDILEDFTSDLGMQLSALAAQHQFLIFEDRKFADIGHTSLLQYEKGIYRIAEWADLINAHIIAGPGIIEGLKQVGLPRARALLLIAQMSAKGTLATDDYTQAAIRMAKEHSDFVIGFIAQQRLVDDPSLIHCTPGVKLTPSKDSLGQQYRTVQDVIALTKSDCIIVGRDIICAQDPEKMAETYRIAAWQAYENRL